MVLDAARYFIESQNIREMATIVPSKKSAIRLVNGKSDHRANPKSIT
jgi:hypothetical protein